MRCTRPRPFRLAHAQFGAVRRRWRRRWEEEERRPRGVTEPGWRWMRQVRPPSRPSDARDAIRAHPLDPEREQARPERCAPHFGLVATPPPKAPPTSREAPPISLCPAPPPPAGRTPVKTPPPNRPRLLWPRPVSHVGHAPCRPCAPIGPNPFLAPSLLTLLPNHTSPHFLTTPTAVAPPPPHTCSPSLAQTPILAPPLLTVPPNPTPLPTLPGPAPSAIPAPPLAQALP